MHGVLITFDVIKSVDEYTYADWLVGANWQHRISFVSFRRNTGTELYTLYIYRHLYKKYFYQMHAYMV